VVCTLLSLLVQPKCQWSISKRNIDIFPQNIQYIVHQWHFSWKLHFTMLISHSSWIGHDTVHHDISSQSVSLPCIISISAENVMTPCFIDILAENVIHAWLPICRFWTKMSMTIDMVHWQSTYLPFFHFESGMSVMNDVVLFDSRVIV